MICSRCETKFCWRCLDILPNENPYSHFDIQGYCWDISAAHIEDEYEVGDDDEEIKSYVV